MNYNDVKTIYDKAKLIKDIRDMQSDCNEICYLLSQKQPDVQKMIDKINSVNKDHPENYKIHNLLFPPQGSPNPNAPITVQSLIIDLNWKLKYLTAKINAKTFDEFMKDVDDLFKQVNGTNYNGGMQ